MPYESKLGTAPVSLKLDGDTKKNCGDYLPKYARSTNWPQRRSESSEAWKMRPPTFTESGMAWHGMAAWCPLVKPEAKSENLEPDFPSGYHGDENPCPYQSGSQKWWLTKVPGNRANYPQQLGLYVLEASMATGSFGWLPILRASITLEYSTYPARKSIFSWEDHILLLNHPAFRVYRIL